MSSNSTQKSRKSHWSALAVRVLWMVGLALVIARIFTPDRPDREETFLDSGNLAALQEGNSKVKITPPPPGGMHGPMHNMGDGSTTATLVRKSPIADNELTLTDLRSTKLGRKPPPIFQDKMKNLNKKTVKMIGFMVPFDSLTDLRTFLLFENPMGCNFCAPPSPKEVVLVRIKKDSPQEFIDAPIEVEGTLDLWRDESDDPAHKSFLYVVNDAKVSVAKDVKVNKGDGW